MVHFLKYFRHCPVCTKSIEPIEWLCLSCQSDFFKKLSFKTRWIGQNIKHHYLMDWQKNDGFSQVVHSLKGAGQDDVFKVLCTFFPEKGCGSGAIYFPSGGKKDHAMILAQSFGQRWQRTTLPILKVDARKQALLNRKGRFERRFLKVPGCLKSVDLVDDIVTTGSTAMGCYQALGQPPKMAVWSLFYRKSL